MKYSKDGSEKPNGFQRFRNKFAEAIQRFVYKYYRPF